MVKYRSSKDFWENKYQKRDKEHWEARRKELLESHVEESPFITYLVNLKPTPRIVLDYGCGTGKNLRALEEKLADPGTRLYGLDVSPTALELAKEYIHGRAALQMTNGTEIPFEDKFFDMSFTHCVLQHVPPLDFEKICDELIRVTRDTIIHKEEMTDSGNKYKHDYEKFYRDRGLEVKSFVAEEINDKTLYLIHVPLEKS